MFEQNILEFQEKFLLWIFPLGFSENVHDDRFWIVKENSYFTQNGVNGSIWGTQNESFKSFL